MKLSLLALAALILAGCAQTPTQAPPPSVTELAARPAERALLAGLRAYEDAKYPEAERLLSQALQAGLASPKDQAAAHKHLAFIYCTSQRQAQCEAAFRAARAADPNFELSKSEAGHPLWGPVFLKSRL
jgi:Tfp pilus assembly protein PilF